MKRLSGLPTMLSLRVLLIAAALALPIPADAQQSPPTGEELAAALQTCLGEPGHSAREKLAACDTVLSVDKLTTEGRATALGYRGAAKSELFDFTGAVVDFTEAYELMPRNPLFLVGRADALSQLDRNGDALKDLDLAIQIAPEAAGLYNRRAIIHILRDNSDAAYRDLEHARELDPSNLETMSLLGRFLVHDGAFDRALEVLNDALARYPDSPQLYVRRALARLSTDDPEGAIADLDEAIDRVGENPDTLLLRAIAHGDLDETDAAHEDYSSVIALDPTVAAAWHGRGTIRMERKEYAAAREDLDVAAQIEPTSRNLNSLAWLLVAAEDKAFRDPREALDLVERAIEQDENPDNVDTAAAAHALLGNEDAAMRYYIRSMELGGDRRVRMYQEYLAGAGYYAGRIDGLDGPMTRDAIRDFARDGKVLLVD